MFGCFTDSTCPRRLTWKEDIRLPLLTATCVLHSCFFQANSGIIPNVSACTYTWCWNYPTARLKCTRFAPWVDKLLPHCLNSTYPGVRPWLMRSVAGLPPQRPGFSSRPVHEGYVVDRMALGLVFLRAIRVFGQYHSINASFSFIYHRHYIILPIDGVVK